MLLQQDQVTFIHGATTIGDLPFRWALFPPRVGYAWDIDRVVVTVEFSVDGTLVTAIDNIDLNISLDGFPLTTENDLKNSVDGSSFPTMKVNSLQAFMLLGDARMFPTNQLTGSLNFTNTNTGVNAPITVVIKTAVYGRRTPGQRRDNQ